MRHQSVWAGFGSRFQCLCTRQGAEVGRAGVPSGSAQPRATSGVGQVAAIRAWANENGHSVSSRGRISADVVSRTEQRIRIRKGCRHLGASSCSSVR
ncbi:Lsr2 dimerization domain-containing protein [Nocardia ninae]|uniref:Lsr2 family DNA-binding protein n=1 Tax=Nocardia ninae TaxID=356145 RepID=UPI001FE7DF05|nr:histone-like nucleoid-structuring protein Lsr2 [Nocardia ninae]